MKTFTLLVIAALLSLSAADAPDDLVNATKLTGAFSGYKHPFYSGFLKVNDTKYHHYFFFPSQNDPTKDPLVLWLNGGPGCSSALGFLYEHGPYFFPDNSTDLQSNPFSWNLNASIIYMESPAAVGYSYADAIYSYDDDITASDNLVALLDWFKKFNEYSNRPFFITGESYGGIYVPTLAYKIDRYNADPSSPSRINLKGFGVGNGVTDHRFDTDKASVDFYWNHGLYPPPLRAEIEANCPGMNTDDPVCAASIAKMEDLTENLALNIYDIYKPCYYGTTNSSNDDLKGATFDYTRWKSLMKKNQTDNFKAVDPNNGNVPGAPKCLDANGSYIWLNDPQNKEALHIRNPITGGDIKKTWYMCVMNDTELNYTPGKNASYWVYPLMINKGYKIVIYSGSTDGSVPVVGTKRWIEQLRKDENLALLLDWKKFYVKGAVSPNPQVGGYYSLIDGGMTFIQVNGVGHMVPQWQREAGKKIIDYLVQDVPL